MKTMEDVGLIKNPLQKKDIHFPRVGKEGEKKELELRLKMIADVGFIGFPNAGKSTLLAAVSSYFALLSNQPHIQQKTYLE